MHDKEKDFTRRDVKDVPSEGMKENQKRATSRVFSEGTIGVNFDVEIE